MPQSFSAAIRRAALGLLFIPRLVGAQEPLSLARAVATAQDKGDQAQAAKATREAARYRDRAFYSRLLPQVSLTGTLPQYNRSIIQAPQPDGSTLFRPQNQTNADLAASISQRIPVTGGSLYLSSSLARLTVSGDQASKTWSSTPFVVGVQQPIFRPNLLAWDRREQPVRSELAERQYKEAKEDIAVQTTGLFFDAFAAQVALDNATKNAAVNDTLYTLNQGRFQVGKIGENDLLQSELALLRSRTSLDGAKLDFDRTLAALRIALRLGPEVPLQVAAPSAIPGFEPDPVKAVREALANGASSSDAALQEVQADRRVTEARLNNGIGATINARFGFNATAPEVSSVYNNLLETRQLSVSVEVPVLQWGMHKETVQAARMDRERVAALNRSSHDQTEHDAKYAALQLSQARRNVALSAKADSVAGKRFEVAYNRYVIGRIQLDNLFLAQSEKDQALSQFVQALRGYWTAYYRLRRVTLYDFEADRSIE